MFIKNLSNKSILFAMIAIMFYGCKKDETTSPAVDGVVSSAVFNTSKTYGTMTDQDGNTYKTITIGTQTWMAENLRVTKYRNGDPIPNVTDNAAWIALNTGAYCNYENTTDKNKIATYGRLYNWYAAVDSRNIAPIGWHVFTDKDWTTLTTFLGDNNLGGGKMKEAGNTHWAYPNKGATNESGFTGLPSGYRQPDDGSFLNLGFKGYWWSSTDHVGIWVGALVLDYQTAGLLGDMPMRQFGLPVRCVKD